MLVKMASPQTPPPKREGLINLLAKSPSLLGEGDLGGEAEIRQEKTKELYSSTQSYRKVRKAKLLKTNLYDLCVKSWRSLRLMDFILLNNHKIL
jgi:hypothetical protein